METFPLILVATAALFSAIYRHCDSRDLTASVRRMLITYHAFATEILQILTLGKGIAVAWSAFVSETIMLDIYIISGLKNFPVPAWLVFFMDIILYPLALFAIDLIDNRIQLGCWQHPFQPQTLLLTRSLLFSWSVRKKPRRVVKKSVKKPTKKQMIRKKIYPVSTTPYQRKRTTSEPVTPEMLRRFLREVPVEVSKSGELIRRARAHARRSSAADTVSTATPSKVARENAQIWPRTPGSMPFVKKYAVQSKIEGIEKVIGDGLNELQATPQA